MYLLLIKRILFAVGVGTPRDRADLAAACVIHRALRKEGLAEEETEV